MLIHACDICRKPLKDPMPFYLRTGTQIDPVEGTVDSGETYELCYEHTILVLRKGFALLTNAQCEMVDADIKKLIRTHR